MRKIRPFLWFDDRIKDAVNLYVSVFTDGESSARRAGWRSEAPGK